MAIWKSPVFYFGLLLLLAVTGALIAPFVIDWNQYKNNLEGYGEKLTGRMVQINGPVAVRLFPFPRLQADKVKIANSDTADSGVFAEADRVTVRIALDGLFAGEVRVQEITVERPVFQFARDATDNVNWHLTPQVGLRNSGLLEQVKLDRINVIDAVVKYKEANRPVALAVEKLNASFSAPSIEGPWRSTGTAQFLGNDAGFVLTTSEKKYDEPLRLGLKVTPVNPLLPSVGFDGTTDETETKGKIRLDSATNDNAKGDLEPAFQPLSMQGILLATDGKADVTDIRITPADSSDGSLLVEGNIKIELTDHITARTSFKSPRLNLDSLFGEKSVRTWQSTGALRALNRFMAVFPKALDFRLNFTAAAMTVANETLENVEVVAETESDAIRLRRLSAQLPGKTRILADGIVFSSGNSADFGGKIALESNDFRILTGWLRPQFQPAISKWWKGSRGQVKLQSQINWSEKQLGLSETQFEFDGALGSGAATFTLGQAPEIDIGLKMSRLNVDDLLPAGVTLASGDDGALSWQHVVQALVASGQSTPTRFTFLADSISVNGVTAQSVSLDSTSSIDALEIASFGIGSVQGAQVTAKGRLTQVDGAYEGVLRGGMVADDPLPVLRLLGVANESQPAKWQTVLGRTTLSANVVFTRGTDEPHVSYAVDGQSGPLNLSLTSKSSSIASADGPTSKGVATIGSADAGNLLRLFGLEPQTADASDGKLVIGFDGNLAAGYKVNAELLGYTAKLAFDGTYQISGAPLPALDGSVLLSSEDAAKVMQIVGLPVSVENNGPLQMTALLKPGVDMLRVTELAGKIAGQSFAGEISILPDLTVNADVSGGAASLAKLLAMAVMPWDGVQAGLDRNFADTAPFGMNGEVWYRPDTLLVFDNYPVRESVVGFKFEGRERQVTIAGRNANGEQINFEAAILPASNQYTLAMTGKIPFEMQSALATAEARPILSGAAEIRFKTSGTGLTPLAALSDLTGEGAVAVQNGGLLEFSPGTFSTAVASVKSADDLRSAIASLQRGNEVKLGDRTFPFNVATGRASLAPFSIAEPGADVQVTGEADLVERTLSATVRVKIKSSQDLPTVDLQLSGPPSALRRRFETSALAGKLGYEIMAREMAELERVQAEQQRVIEQEEAQRQLDEERFKAYQEQRAELRLRQRELKVFAVQRQIDALALKNSVLNRLDEFGAMNKTDLAKRTREGRLLRVTANGAISKPVKTKRVEVPKLEDLPQYFELPTTDGLTSPAQ